jgi:hypothetical protein
MAEMCALYNITIVKPRIITIKDAETGEVSEKIYIYNALDDFDDNAERTIVVRYDAEGEVYMIEVWEGSMDEVKEKIKQELEELLDQSFELHAE